MKFLKFPALALLCYLGGLWFFQHPQESKIDATDSTQTVTPRKSTRSHPLNQAGALQVESTLSLVNNFTSPEACQDFAAQLHADPDNRHSKTLWSILLSRWSQIDPEGMLAFLAEEKDAGRPTRMEGLAWQAWGASDPRGAFAQLHRIDGDLPKELFKGIAQVDPDLAIELAFQATGAAHLVKIVLENGSQFTEQTLDKLKELSNISAITWDLNKVLQKHGATGDPAHDLKIFRAHKNTYENSAPFFEELTKKKPLEALAVLEQDPPSQDRAISTVAVAKRWALTDSDASLAWARQQTSPQIKTNALVAIASVIGGKNPDLGLSLIEEVAWAETQNLEQIRPVSGGKVVHSTMRYENYNQTLKIASSIFQNLAASDPSAARIYLNEKSPQNIVLISKPSSSSKL